MKTNNRRPINYCCMCGVKTGKITPFTRAVATIDTNLMLGILCLKCSNNDDNFMIL
jgi:hypothetical protein